MTAPVLVADFPEARVLRLVEPGAELNGFVARWAEAHAFTGKSGQLLTVPGPDGQIDQALLGTGERFDPLILRGAAARLPAGTWRIEGEMASDTAGLAALAFALGTYRFDRYRSGDPRPQVQLVGPPGVNVVAVSDIAEACALTRELVDTPAADMGPGDLETVARDLAGTHGASVAVTVGDELRSGYPALHAVGRAATPERGPRVIEIGWNLDRTDRPLVALVGKGVVFDTGGLDLKAAASMRNMKKDMGGAAHVLGLAQLLMQSGLDGRLIVLVGAVENAVSGDAFRPGDILNTRKGLTVEVGNTDAEGRLVLADLLTRAGEYAPELTIDFATLTGAARVALGPELPPLYTDDDILAADLLASAARVRDPLWRMPLWPGYRSAVEAEIADLRNDPAGWAQAGSVTAALFLQRFAPATGAWAHLDVFAWNPRNRPGHPEGGEAQGLRACHDLLMGRFGAR